MAALPVSLSAFLLVLLQILLDVCEAGRFCNNGDYCPYGCCGAFDNECCDSSVALIVGVCVGGAVFIFILIIICCVCQRRRYQGTVFRQAAGPTIITQSTVTTSGGVVTTSGVQPGYVYPAAYVQPVGPYGQTLVPPYGQPAPVPAYAAPPPAYSEVSQGPAPYPQPSGAAGGNVNPAFDSKN